MPYQPPWAPGYPSPILFPGRRFLESSQGEWHPKTGSEGEIKDRVKLIKNSNSTSDGWVISLIGEREQTQEGAALAVSEIAGT